MRRTPTAREAARSAKRIRLLIIEDNRLLRDGLNSVLSKQPDLNVVGAIGDGERTIAVIRTMKPRVVLLDLGLRYRNSLRIVRAAKGQPSAPKIIAMALVPTQADVFEYIQAGVSGFLLKDATLAELMKTVRSVARGEKILPRTLTDSLFAQIVDQAVKEVTPSRLNESVRMTKRERQIVALVAEGLSNKEIAYRIHLSSHTVKSHVHNILEKLSLHSRVQIATYAGKTRTAAGTISLIGE